MTHLRTHQRRGKAGKPTRVQREVLEYLQDGRNYIYPEGMVYMVSCLGRVLPSTVTAMKKRGWIDADSIGCYYITPAGRQALAKAGAP